MMALNKENINSSTSSKKGEVEKQKQSIYLFMANTACRFFHAAHLVLTRGKKSQSSKSFEKKLYNFS